MCGVGKGFVLVVGVQREHFLIDIGDEQVFPAIGIDVSRVHAHAGARLAVLAEAHFSRQRDLLPFAFATIDEQKILHRIIGHEQVHEPVVIDVGSHYAESFA